MTVFPATGCNLSIAFVPGSDYSAVSCQFLVSSSKWFLLIVSGELFGQSSAGGRRLHGKGSQFNVLQ